MRIQQLLEHHGIAENPFVEEDAQTDPVFKRHCIGCTYHPAWDKVYGDPSEPSTAIVFGEKGSGKTAMRIQIARHLADYNREHPDARVFTIEYDDFNPYLDRFAARVGALRRSDRVLKQWKLWDHMDAILMQGVTALADRILEVRDPGGPPGLDVAAKAVDRLDRHQARDLLLLAACYDQSTAETFEGRWHRLRRRLRFSTLKAAWQFALGAAATIATLALMVWLAAAGHGAWLTYWWLYLVPIAAGWTPWLWRAQKAFRRAFSVVRGLRVGNREIGSMWRVLMHFTTGELVGQPLPERSRTDDRYESFYKLQGILRTLGFQGIVVLVDRVDEPHRINGSTELMRDLVWPMLDNKFLKQPGTGLKLMLPIELQRFVEREDKQFYERARLDKQNMIPTLQWTGEALFDVANARIRGCAATGRSPTIRDLFAGSVSDRRLIDAFRSLRVPRHLFKFLYRLLVAHANAYTEAAPQWEISSETFEAELALYTRQQEAFDRGLGAG